MQAVTKKRIKRILCAGIAASLIGTGLGTTFFGGPDEVYAKETLQSIETIVNEAMETDENGTYTNPFTILEIVPDNAVSEVAVNGIDETGATISRKVGFEDIDGNGNDFIQNAGTAGYYVKGQEPVTKDLIKYLSDAEITDDSGVNTWKMTELKDSVSRANFASQLLEPVKGNSAFVAANADDTSKPLYVTGDYYKELREGEIIVDSDDLDKDGDTGETLEVTGELLGALMVENSYHYITHDYSGKDFNAEASGEDAYVDVAKGIMKPVENISEESGNYTLSYEPVLKEDDSTGEMVLHTEEDKAYRFVSGETEGDGKVYFSKADLEGEFDPYLICNASDAATHRATFAYVKGATSGYKVEKVSEPLTSEKIKDLALGLPLYIYDEENQVYVFVGFVAYNEETKEKYLDNSKTTITGLMFLEGKSAEVSSFSLLRNSTLASLASASPSASASASVSPSASALPTSTAVASATPTTTPTEVRETASPSQMATPVAVPTASPQEAATPTVAPTTAITAEPTIEPTEAPEETPQAEPTEAPTATVLNEAPETAKLSARTEIVLNRILLAPPLEQLSGGRKILFEQEVAGATASPTVASTEAPKETPAVEPTEAPEETPTVEPTEAPEETPAVEPTEAPKETPTETSEETEEGFLSATPKGEGAEDDSLSMTGFSMLRAVAPTQVPITDTTDLYILDFTYTEEENDVEPLYQVSYYDMPTREEKEQNNNSVIITGYTAGAQYVINTDNRGSIVTNQNGTGTISRGEHASEIATQFIYDYTPGIGFYNWTGEEWITDGADGNVCRIRGAKIYFNTGLENRDWFKQYVFDREEEECAKLPVIVNTIAANDVTVEDINQNKLLLLQYASAADGGFAYKVAIGSEAGLDLSADVCKEIIRKVVQESYPVVSDYRIADEYITYASNPSNPPLSTAETPNIYFLVKGLTLNGLSMYYETVGASGADLKFIDPEDYGKQIDANDFNNVNTSVYTRKNGAFLNTEFMTPESDEQVIQDGYAEVLLDIQNENIYRKTSDLEGEIPEEISQATVIRYILGYANKRAYETKGSLNLLELAPCNVYTLKVTSERNSDGDVIKSTIYTVTEDSTGNLREELLIELKETEIHLTQMTTAEFIGRVEDINAHYDMIYISSETGEYQYEDEKYLAGGNDITKDKQNDLFDFVEAGYPVIVADDLIIRETADDGSSTLTVNSDTVDEDSYLYDFLDEVKKEENVFRLNNVSAPLLSMYVNLSRPSVELTSEEGDNPTPWYSAMKEVIPLSKQSDGSYLAEYEFKVENKGAGGSDETFDCRLLIDMNCDGKYSDVSEEVEDVYVTDTSGNGVGKDSDGRYQLKAGGTYRLSYVVSSEYHGVIPWRIRITQNDDTNLRRADVTGYYSIKNPDGQRENIKVLQITSDNSNFDMEKATSLDAATVFKKLLTDKATVPYDVEISTIPISQFSTTGIKAKFGEDKSPDSDNSGWLSTEELLAFLRSFDMLVLGSDYDFWNTGALDAIKAYAEEGRSVLVMHDMTKPGTGEKFNHYLKETIGMTEAVTYPDLIKDGDDDAVDYPMLEDLSSSLYYAENISRINQGRITMYPYLLESEYLEIQETHGQHWQLDLERDADEDEETDLVVWYALENRNGSGEGIYDASPNDANNNYYLYSMGNIFYSGIGHDIVCKGTANGSGVIEATQAEVNEVKLFINTLIAAYEAGIHYPSVNIIESYQPTSRDITSVYVSYDDQLKAVSETGITAGVLDFEQDIYFKAEPASMIYNNQTATHKFTAEFYVEMPSPEGAQALSFNGSTVYGRKLVATEGGYDGVLYYLDEAGIEQVLAASGDGTYNLSPNVVYKTKIPISVLGDFSGAIFDERGAEAYANARNARRIFVVVNEQVTNTRTNTTIDASAIDILSVVRVQVFDLD